MTSDETRKSWDFITKDGRVVTAKFSDAEIAQFKIKFPEVEWGK